MADLIAQLDTLQDEKKYQEVFDLVNPAAEQDPDNLELQWRLARSLYDLSEETVDKKEKERLVKKAHEITTALVAKAPEFWAANKWHAIVLGSLGDYLSTADKVKNAFLIKDHAQKAVALMPEDATTHHLLGRLCFNIAGISWIERKIAATLFGEPPKVTYEDALGHFLNAHKFRENFLKNAVWIGHTHAKIGNKPDARAAYQLAIDMPVLSADDRKTLDEARTALSKL